MLKIKRKLSIRPRIIKLMQNILKLMAKASKILIIYWMISLQSRVAVVPLSRIKMEVLANLKKPEPRPIIQILNKRSKMQL